jgi:dTDP-glucose pyrophosphorylase
MEKSQEIWHRAALPGTASLADAIANLDSTAVRLVLVTDERGQLQGTVSDGDIRRALLNGHPTTKKIVDIMNRNALVVPSNMDPQEVVKLMVANKLQQIPVVDNSNLVVGLHLWDELQSPRKRINRIIIMAGGEGRRLRPLTENCPKPLLQVAGKPILEHIVERAISQGFNHFVLAVNYLGHMIEEQMGDGSRYGVRIEYLREDVPLGTAGALSLIKEAPEEPLIVTNGDVISDIGYTEILDFHLQHKPLATVAVRSYEWQNPFGVVKTEGTEVIGLEEKPVSRSNINAGIYVIDPPALAFLKMAEYIDMPGFLNGLTRLKKRVIAYPMHEPWLDVGRAADLEKANKQVPRSTPVR